MILSNVVIFRIFCLLVDLLKTKKNVRLLMLFFILMGLNLKIQYNMNIKIGQKTEQLFAVN